MKVGVLEGTGILESIAEEPIERDVTCPDDADRCHKRKVLQVADSRSGIARKRA